MSYPDKGTESKNILVICPGKIFPVHTGSQLRMYYMIKELSKGHKVDVAFLALTNHDRQSQEEMEAICQRFFPIVFQKAICTLANYCSKALLIHPLVFYHGLPMYKKRLREIVGRENYDIIQFEYWYPRTAIAKLPYPAILAIDTHNVTSEKYRRGLIAQKAWFQDRRVRHFRRLEMKYTRMNDVIISISEDDAAFFKHHFPDKSHLTIPIGQDLDGYLDYPERQDKGNIILFYGGLNSVSNTEALFRLVANIFPEIEKTIPDVKLWIVGSNPTTAVKALDDRENIKVFGFVEDIRPTVSQCKLFLLPLRIAAGFRTRLVEVMAMGVPIVGTHAGLDSLKPTHKEQVFISDNDSEMAKYATSIIKDDHLRRKMGQACRALVKEHFSVESTFSVLNEYYQAL